MKLINWDIIRHPLNWVIVALMLVIFGAFLDVILPDYDSTN